MIKVRIVGGLGNQMFQYAYARALKELGYDVAMDLTEFKKYTLHGGYWLDRYNITLKNSKITPIKRAFYSIQRRILKKLGKSNGVGYIACTEYGFKNYLMHPKENDYITGYFQSYKFFENIREILLKEFVIKDKISDYGMKIVNLIKNESHSCSIHIRRGDYLNGGDLYPLDISYYHDAVNYMKQKNKNLKYFVFSDDIEWVKENLRLENAFYINSKEKRIPHEDIMLMSMCDHNIIANSTFSWWGAWLNTNRNKIVIAPKKWHKNEIYENKSKDIKIDNWIIF